MKKRILLLPLLLLIFTACAKTDSPENAVSDLLDAYKSGDRTAVESLLVSPETANAFYSFEEDDVLDELITERTKEDLTYKDLTESIDGDSATVTAQVDYPDIGTPFMASFQEAVVKAQEEAGSDPDAILTWIKEDVEQRMESNVEMISEQIEVAVVKVEDAWKVDLDNSPALLNAMMGNLANVLTAEPAQ